MAILTRNTGTPGLVWVQTPSGWRAMTLGQAQAAGLRPMSDVQNPGERGGEVSGPGQPSGLNPPGGVYGPIGDTNTPGGGGGGTPFPHVPPTPPEGAVPPSLVPPAATAGPWYGNLLRNPLLGAGLTFAGGLLPKSTTTTQTPTLDPLFAPLQGQVLQMITNRLTNPAGVPPGYVGAGIRGINTSYDLAGRATENALTSRGLGTSPIAGQADLTRNLARAGAVGDFRANIPIVGRELQNEDLGLASNLLATGRGLSQTTSGGGGLAGGATNLSAYLGYLQGLGKFGAPANPYGSYLPNQAY